MEDLKEIISKNLIKFRREAKLTQLELAEKIKYSDKNISKWERAEAVPDVIVLKQLADFYGVNVDDFLKENSASININEQEQSKYFSKERFMNRKQLLITFLSVGIVWLVATILFTVFVNISIFEEKAWLVFVYAITISCIVALVFTSLWCTNLINCIVVGFLIWSTALSIFFSIKSNEIWYVFLVAIPVQILDILWFILRKININWAKIKEEKEKQKQQKAKIKEEKRRIKQLKIEAKHIARLEKLEEEEKRVKGK